MSVITVVSIKRKNFCLSFVIPLRLLLLGEWKPKNQVLILIFIIDGLTYCLVKPNLRLVSVLVCFGLYIVFEFLFSIWALFMPGKLRSYYMLSFCFLKKKKGKGLVLFKLAHGQRFNLWLLHSKENIVGRGESTLNIPYVLQRRLIAAKRRKKLRIRTNIMIKKRTLLQFLLIKSFERIRLINKIILNYILLTLPPNFRSVAAKANY